MGFSTAGVQRTAVHLPQKTQRTGKSGCYFMSGVISPGLVTLRASWSAFFTFFFLDEIMQGHRLKAVFVSSMALACFKPSELSNHIHIHRN